MAIENRPAEYEFAGNLADMKVTGITSPVTFVLAVDGVQIVEETYSPDPIGIITIRLRDLLEIAVPCPTMTVAAQPAALYTWSITGGAVESGSFRCLKGGHLAGVDAATYLKTNFLTWQPQTRHTLYHTPHWLRYVAVIPGCRFRAKGYFLDGTDQTVYLTEELGAGQIHTIETTYGTIRERFDRPITYYDVWVECAGVASTWVQRYVLTDHTEGTPDFFVFENSLGGFDTVCFRGDRKDVAEPESLNAAFDDRTLEYDVDWKQSFQKNTGYFPDLNTRLWALDFFSSANRYHLAEGVLHRIVVSRPKLEATEGELAGYEFTYAYAKQSRYMNLPRVPVPPALEIVNPAGELFFLEPRLNQFRRADATVGDVLIPVQYAHSPEWMTITLFDILKLAGGEGSGGLWDIVFDTLSKKYDKVGGPIRGNVQIEEDDDGYGGYLDVEHTATANHVETRRDVTVGQNAQSAEFASGPLGAGWRIEREGNGEMESLVLRRFLEAPEFRKNKISVIGDEFWVSAAGLIESVRKAKSLPVYVKGRKVLGKDGKPWRIKTGPGYVVRFKLEEGDSHAFKKDDILVSKFEQEGGFQTAWFRVKYVLSSREIFVTALNGYAPQVAMNVARQGNFTDPTRQNSIYISGKEGYIRVLSGVNSTEIKFENIRCQYGNLEGLTVDGIGALSGYGEYSDNAYKRGVFLMQGGKRVEEFVQDTVEELQDSLGGLAFKDKVEKALLGNTIISGGYIRSDLIAVDDALVERLVASDAFIKKLTASEAFVDKLVARAVSTQQGDNPQRVNIQRGDGAISVVNADGEVTLNINSGEKLDNGWTNGGIYLKQRMYNGQLHQCHVGADEISFSRADYDIHTEVDFNGMMINGIVGGVRKQALYNLGGITLPQGAVVDMPGVLAAGQISAKGTISNQWGCKSCGSVKYNGQTGKYKITHNIGHTNYFIQATPCGTDNTWAKVHAIILEKTSTYAVVAIYDSGTNNTGVDTDFEFLIVGDK